MRSRSDAPVLAQLTSDDDGIGVEHPPQFSESGGGGGGGGGGALRIYN